MKIREAVVKHPMKQFLFLIVQMNIYLVRQRKWRDEERGNGKGRERKRAVKRKGEREEQRRGALSSTEQKEREEV